MKEEEYNGGYRIGNVWHEAATDRPVGIDPTRDESGKLLTDTKDMPQQTVQARTLNC